MDLSSVQEWKGERGRLSSELYRVSRGAEGASTRVIKPGIKAV